MTGAADRRLIVLFGAAVRADGRPSPTLARRIGYAATTAERDPETDLFCSGGIGREGPSEASVMARALAPTIAPERVHLDEISQDTLQSVVAAVAVARARGYRACLSCTDSYHQPRVLMLFALFGMPCSAIRFARDGSSRYQARMWAREALALPYDLVAGLNQRIRGGAAAPPR